MRRRGAPRRLAALLLLAACEHALGPQEPVGHVAFVPPPRYQAWWQAVEACAGVTVDFATVEWRVVPDAAVFEYDGGWANGLWLVKGNRIILAEAATLDGEVVRHEMLHAITARGRHTRRAFLDRCAGVVICNAACRADAGAPEEHGDGPPYDSRIRVADRRELEVAMIVRPAHLSLSAGTFGWSTITVSARNPLPEPVYVRVPENRVVAGRGRGDVLGWRGHRLAGEIITGDTLVRFEAGETRRALFDIDFLALSRAGGVTGEHVLSGVFAGFLFGSTGLVLEP